MHVFFTVFYKSEKTCFLCFYSKINVFIIYASHNINSAIVTCITWLRNRTSQHNTHLYFPWNAAYRKLKTKQEKHNALPTMHIRVCTMHTRAATCTCRPKTAWVKLQRSLSGLYISYLYGSFKNCCSFTSLSVHLSDVQLIRSN